MTTLQPLLARFRAISTPMPETCQSIVLRRWLHKVLLPLDAPVTMLTLPSSGRWLELLPRFVDAVRTCAGLADMLMRLVDDLPSSFSSFHSVAAVVGSQIFLMAGLQ